MASNITKNFSPKIKNRPKLAEHKYLVKNIKQVDKNCYYSNYGPLYKKAQKEVLKFFRIKKNTVVFSSSGDAALNAIYIYLKKNNPKKKFIITPAYNFYSGINSIIRSGFEPIFVDINLDNFLIMEDQLSFLLKKYKNKVAAINYVSPHGFPLDIKRLNWIKKKYNIPIVYDAADAFINFDKNLDRSNFFITSSFHPTKNLPSNESGLIICKKNLEKKFQVILNFGKNLYSDHKMEFVGFNGKFTEYDAAIFLSNFKFFKLFKKKILKKNNFFLRNLNKGEYTYSKGLGTDWCSQKFLIFSNKRNYFPIKLWSDKILTSYKIYKKYKKCDLTNTKKIFDYGINIIIYRETLNTEILSLIKKISKNSTVLKNI